MEVAIPWAVVAHWWTTDEPAELVTEDSGRSGRIANVKLDRSVESPQSSTVPEARARVSWVNRRAACGVWSPSDDRPGLRPAPGSAWLLVASPSNGSHQTRRGGPVRRAHALAHRRRRTKRRAAGSFSSRLVALAAAARASALNRSRASSRATVAATAIEWLGYDLGWENAGRAGVGVAGSAC